MEGRASPTGADRVPAVSLAGSDARRAYDACAFARPGPRDVNVAPTAGGGSTDACFELFFVRVEHWRAGLFACLFHHASPTRCPGLDLLAVIGVSGPQRQRGVQCAATAIRPSG